jgi:hypothetical protein
LDGNYLSAAGSVMRDRVNLLYTDTPFSFETNFATLSAHTDKLRLAALNALEEEVILVVVYPVFHSQ